jgi:hypothetical protein
VCRCVKDKEESREKSIYIFREGCVHGPLRLNRRSWTVLKYYMLAHVVPPIILTYTPSPSRTDSAKLLHACARDPLHYIAEQEENEMIIVLCRRKEALYIDSEGRR